MESLFQKHPLNTPEMQEWLKTNSGFLKSQNALTQESLSSAS